MTSLQARWDKFELMMESHQLMVKEQVLSYVVPHSISAVQIICLHAHTYYCVASNA